MKKLILFLICTVLLAAAFSAASAEPLGFGFVNSTDVALRRGIGGKTIVRLPENTCVWIHESETDAKGVLWYRINAGLHISHTNVDYTGWMKAEFIDAGEKLWHDVQSVSVSRSGLVTLRRDGTAEAAGSQIVSGEGSGRDALCRWARELRDIQQAGLCEHGLIFYALDRNGICHESDRLASMSGPRFRLTGGSQWIWGITDDHRLLRHGAEVTDRWVYPHAPGPEDLAHAVSLADNGCRLLLLTDGGNVFVTEDESGDTEPDWTEWTDLVSVEASAGIFAPGGRTYQAAYAAVRRDGTVLAAPEELAVLTGSWTGMSKVVIGDRWVLGLKQDGTVLSAGFSGAVPPDVSGWTGITDLGAGYDFCAGVRSDGSLVFAGEYVFMREGHHRK